MVTFLFSVHTITEAQQWQGDPTARSIDLARPGVAPPLIITLERKRINFTYAYVRIDLHPFC